MPLIDHLAAFLGRLSPIQTAWIAYSGGVDSTVLLHAASRLQNGLDLRAVHVNHHLHAEAGRWAGHCESVCKQWAVPLTVRAVDARAAAGQSPEAAAREARYEAFRALLQPGEVLLTAQHRDDQGETLLLQLFRGAGPAGLAGMPAVAELGRGRLARPLLDISRDTLLAYAREHRLSWVEDSSNAHPGFSRNYLRHRIWPRLLHHWPGLGRTLARAARLQAGATEVLADCARADLERVADAASGALSVRELGALSPARRNNLLRHWVGRHGARMPSEAVLEQIAAAAAARRDAAPCVTWGGLEVRRYRDRLYLVAPLEPVESGEHRLDADGAVRLPGLDLRLDADRLARLGLNTQNLEWPLYIRFRRGGERIRLPGRAHHHSLKKLLQERAVPPWLRDRLPLVYCGDELIAVLGLEPPVIAAGRSATGNR
jgi:tRNA(Ile)-lysidine synthase